MSRAMKVLFILFGISGLFMGFCFGAGKVFVANHGSSDMAEFDVVGDELLDPDTYSVGFLYPGMVDIEIDKPAGRLFVSWEDWGDISIIDVWDGTDYGDTSIGSDMNITGLAFDSKRFLLYGTERNTNKLYVMDFKTSPKLVKTVRLDGINYVCGLALNEKHDVLYVSEHYYNNYPIFEKVKAYDIHKNFTFINEIDMEVPTVGIAYDGERNILYGTAYRATTPELVKKDLSTGSVISKDLDSAGTGIAVDEETGYVFVSYQIMCLKFMRLNSGILPAGLTTLTRCLSLTTLMPLIYPVLPALHLLTMITNLIYLRVI